MTFFSMCVVSIVGFQGAVVGGVRRDGRSCRLTPLTLRSWSRRGEVPLGCSEWFLNAIKRASQCQWCKWALAGSAGAVELSGGGSGGGACSVVAMSCVCGGCPGLARVFAFLVQSLALQRRRSG